LGDNIYRDGRLEENMAEEKMTLEEWGNRIYGKQYVVLDFNYDTGTTWVLNTKDGKTYTVTYEKNMLIAREETSYTMDWE
jgi:hypothetical protein